MSAHHSAELPHYSLLSCGSNSHGQLGHGHANDTCTYQPVLFDGSALTPGRVEALAFGGTHTLALCSNELEGTARLTELYFSGSNEAGQLGSHRVKEGGALEFAPLSLAALRQGLSKEDQAILDAEDYLVEAIAASWETSFIQLQSRRAGTSDIILSLGGNDWSELGISTPTSTHPVHLLSFDHFVNKDEVVKVSSLTAGPRHILARLNITSASTRRQLLVGWGASRRGQLGKFGIGQRPKTITVPTKLSFDSNNPITVQLAAGRDHTLILQNGSSVTLAGSTTKGQLGPVVEMGDTGHLNVGAPLDPPRGILGPELEWVGSCWTSSFVLVKALDGEQQLWAFGSNAHSQLGTSKTLPSSALPLPVVLPPSPGATLIKVACGSEHVSVLRATASGEREVLSWGWNEHGNIGNGGQTDVEGAAVVMSGAVLDIWAGNATSWVLVAQP